MSMMDEYFAMNSRMERYNVKVNVDGMEVIVGFSCLPENFDKALEMAKKSIEKQIMYNMKPLEERQADMINNLCRELRKIIGLASTNIATLFGEDGLDDAGRNIELINKLSSIRHIADFALASVPNEFKKEKY